MERLAQKDFRLLLDVIGELNRARNPSAFVQAFLDGFPRLVRVEAASYATQEPRCLPTVRWTIGDATAAPLLPALKTFMHQHSFFPHITKTGDLRARQLHDDLSLSQWKQRDLYNEFYRKVGLEHMIGFGFSLQPFRVAGGFRGRGGRPFTERDRLVINLLRPHAIQAYENAATWDLLQHELSTCHELFSFTARGYIECTTSGLVRFATPLVSKWLKQYFFTNLARRLPGELWRWMKTQEGCASRLDDAPRINLPYVVSKTESQLIIRCLRADDQVLLLFEEKRTGVPTEALTGLGLTRRQSEVLAWLARGKTNTEIAAILGVSPRTVQKHTEHVYQTLGVESRVAAVTVALHYLQYGKSDGRDGG